MKNVPTLRMRRHLNRFSVVALGMVSIVACNDSPVVPAPSASIEAPNLQVVSRISNATWAQEIVGKTGPGSTYAMFVPHNWNGDVVYYAHGFVDAVLPIALPGGAYVEGLRNELGSRGFAVAYSSYSENGFAVKDGVQRTHQLRGLFTGATRLRPNRSYLIGQSLGGGIVSAIAEDKAAQYDGVMPVCGMVGGSLLQTQYLGNVRTLFDALFPGVLPGTTISMPANVDVNSQIVGPAQFAVFMTPGGIDKLASMVYSPQTPLPVPLPLGPATFPLAFGSLANALGFHARGTNDILDRTNGATPFDNQNTVYTSLLWSPAVQTGINSVIARYTIAPSAENYLTKNFTPSGDLKIPTLTLHNRYDPVVPEFHQGALQSAADAAGKSSMLVRRIAVAPYGHCAFGAAEVAANFDLLVNWVTSGVKP